VLERVIYAVRLLTRSRPGGAGARATAILITIAAGGLAAAMVLGVSGSWTKAHLHHRPRIAQPLRSHVDSGWFDSGFTD
jgi:hypothetical protein